MQKAGITEIRVRMDCNGCVHKVKKAINGIDGVHDIYIDLPNQKLTVIGRADPERIIKAIKKVRKVAAICSHTEVQDPNSQPPEAPAQEGATLPEPEGGTPTSEEPPKSEEPASENPPAQNPPPEATPPPQDTDNQPRQDENPSKPKDLDEVHVIHHHQPDYGYMYGYGNGYAPDRGYGGQLNNQPGPSFRREPYHPIYEERPQPIYYEPPLPQSVYHEPPPQNLYHEPPPRYGYREPHSRPGYHELPPQPLYHEPPPRHGYREPQPVQVTHSYNTSRPSPYITAYQYVQSPPPPPPPPRYTTYSMMDQYSTDPYWESGPSDRNESSLFSDENPNACTIV